MEPQSTSSGLACFEIYLLPTDTHIRNNPQRGECNTRSEGRAPAASLIESLAEQPLVD
jgi:hypothetical protein